MNSRVHIWSLSGFDPSAHAGILADCEAFNAFSVQYSTVITGLSAQCSKKVHGTKAVPPGWIVQQAKALEEPHAIKVGMIPDLSEAKELIELLKTKSCPIIWDPVIRSSSGQLLMSEEAFLFLKKHLLPIVTLVTPNVQEAQKLSGKELRSPEDYPLVAEALVKMGAQAVLLKDGHGQGKQCQDYFFHQGSGTWLVTPRSPKSTVRGTGCRLASAIAAAYGHLKNWTEAVLVATAYLQHGIELSQNRFVSKAWPVEAQYLPQLTKEPEVWAPSGREIGMGFYPVVPTARWVNRLTQWGVDCIQLRCKSQSDQETEAEISESIHLARSRNCRLYINDHWHLALRHGAYGVHLGQEDVKRADITAIKKAGLRLGISTHSYEELSRALSYKPSYVALGPIFETSSKIMPFLPQGLQRLKTWCQMSPVPVVAIGGLNPDRGRKAKQMGADGVACIRSVIDSPKPRASAQEWMEALRHA